jgi:hypothetical protein
MTTFRGPPDHYFDPPDTDEDDAAADRARARRIIDLIYEELASLPTLDEDDREQAAKDLGDLCDRLATPARMRSDWGAYSVVHRVLADLMVGRPLDLAPANALIATLEEAAREPEYSPDFEPAWEHE